MFPIRNAVNTRLFGAYEPQKIIFDLSHYTKSRPAILKLLDVGAQGLIIPNVHSVAQVEDIISYYCFLLGTL